jgi:hypothetical protein
VISDQVRQHWHPIWRWRARRLPSCRGAWPPRQPRGVQLRSGCGTAPWRCWRRPAPSPPPRPAPAAPAPRSCATGRHRGGGHTKARAEDRRQRGAHDINMIGGGTAQICPSRHSSTRDRGRCVLHDRCRWWAMVRSERHEHEHDGGAISGQGSSCLTSTKLSQPCSVLIRCTPFSAKPISRAVTTSPGLRVVSTSDSSDALTPPCTCRPKKSGGGGGGGGRSSSHHRRL